MHYTTGSILSFTPVPPGRYACFSIGDDVELAPVIGWAVVVARRACSSPDAGRMDG